MLAKTIEYTDYNGIHRKETLYFNLNKAELAKMEVGTAGGYAEMVKKLAETQDGPALLKIFDELIIKAYGEKTPDGRGFRKDPEAAKEFTYTEAYSELFMQLMQNPEEFAAFVNGIIPQDILKQVQEQEGAKLAVLE